VVVGDGQQLGLAFGQPFLGGEALALGTMAVAAAIIGDERVPALLAARDELASWYREFAERAGNPVIWEARRRTAQDLEAEAVAVTARMERPSEQ